MIAIIIIFTPTYDCDNGNDNYKKYNNVSNHYNDNYSLSNNENNINSDNINK